MITDLLRRATCLLRPIRRRLPLCRFSLVLCLYAQGASATPLSIPILYLHQPADTGPVLSNVFAPPEDMGEPGATLGVTDNNTTGRFLKHSYSLQIERHSDQDQILARAKDFVAGGGSLLVVDVSDDTLRALTREKTLRSNALFINAGSPTDSLRRNQCTTGLLHTLPSRAMLADALIQFLTVRRWQKWLLVKGQQPNDAAFADALKRSAKRFGGKIVEEKTWSFDTDLRRVAQQEIPPFTRAGKYDVVLVADESGDVGEYIPYNTWLPRPVAGTQGLTPVAWARVVEQWGAIQLQNRFFELAKREMTPVDYASWLAVRVIGEAVTRSGSANVQDLYSFILSDEFEIAAFKGRQLSFRNWNGQLRQPIPLVHPKALISQSPQEGFLHPVTDLDTLGYDRPEVDCTFSTRMEE